MHYFPTGLSPLQSLFFAHESANPLAAHTLQCQRRATTGSGSRGSLIGKLSKTLPSLDVRKVSLVKSLGVSLDVLALDSFPFRR